MFDNNHLRDWGKINTFTRPLLLVRIGVWGLYRGSPKWADSERHGSAPIQWISPGDWRDGCRMRNRNSTPFRITSSHLDYCWRCHRIYLSFLCCSPPVLLILSYYRVGYGRWRWSVEPNIKIQMIWLVWIYLFSIMPVFVEICGRVFMFLSFLCWGCSEAPSPIYRLSLCSDLKQIT